MKKGVGPPEIYKFPNESGDYGTCAVVGFPSLREPHHGPNPLGLELKGMARSVQTGNSREG